MPTPMQAPPWRRSPLLARPTIWRALQEDLGSFARNTYISGSQLAGDFLLLDSRSPADLIERAGLLESVANSRTDALDRVLVSQARSETADEVATDALNTKVDAEAEARAALDESTAMLEEQQETLTALLEQRPSTTRRSSRR
ncbi:MAG: hypothetical protein WKF47_17770 [Geodermatophilaceae bacterium]